MTTSNDLTDAEFALGILILLIALPIVALATTGSDNRPKKSPWSTNRNDIGLRRSVRKKVQTPKASHVAEEIRCGR